LSVPAAAPATTPATAQPVQGRILLFPHLSTPRRASARGLVVLCADAEPDTGHTVACEVPALPSDKHALDRALSTGRQAVERLALGGADRLSIAIASALALTELPLPPAGPIATYAALATLGWPAATLVGCCLSAAQIGLPVLLLDPYSRSAADYTQALEPRASVWLRPQHATVAAAPAEVARFLPQ
jgi:hypothetical protein